MNRDVTCGDAREHKAPSTSEENGVKVGGLSSAETAELAALIRQHDIDAVGYQCDFPPEPYLSEEPTGLEGEELEQFNRRRNAFHSRKKRRRKKVYDERLQVCLQQASHANKRLKAQHALLSSAIEKTNKIICLLEANSQMTMNRGGLLDQNGFVAPINTFVGGQTHFIDSISNTISGPRIAALCPCSSRSESQILDRPRFDQVLANVADRRPSTNSVPIELVGILSRPYHPDYSLLTRTGVNRYGLTMGAATRTPFLDVASSTHPAAPLSIERAGNLAPTIDQRSRLLMTALTLGQQSPQAASQLLPAIMPQPRVTLASEAQHYGAPAATVAQTSEDQMRNIPYMHPSFK